MKVISMKLPKQIKHWIRKFGLRVDVFRPKQYETNLYYKGKGRRWRICWIDDIPHLQVSTVYSEFDRWANSLAYSTPLDCKTYKDFRVLTSRMMECIK